MNFKRNKEYPTVTPGVGIILRAWPNDRGKNDKANNFYICDVITHTESVNGSVSYTRVTKTFERKELRELLGLGSKERIVLI